MTEFAPFSKAVHARHVDMSTGELFVSEVTGDELFEAYLAAFPEGTNPIFRTKTEYDCSCCRNYIKNLGRVVSIKDGQLQTVWDGLGHLEYPFNVVAGALEALIKSKGISGVYRTQEQAYGAETTNEILEGGDVRKWNHFHGKVFKTHYSKDAAADAGKMNSTAGVFKRGLEEITSDAIKSVQDLIAAKALYRGEEFSAGVNSFASLHAKFILLPAAKLPLFPWEHFYTPGARIRNTAMGTLLQDLSEGMDLEKAVKAYEAKVAPENYKRTTALITPAMIKKGLEALNALGLESALSLIHI